MATQMFGRRGHTRQGDTAEEFRKFLMFTAVFFSCSIILILLKSEEYDFYASGPSVITCEVPRHAFPDVASMFAEGGTYPSSSLPCYLSVLRGSSGWTLDPNLKPPSYTETVGAAYPAPPLPPLEHATTSTDIPPSGTPPPPYDERALPTSERV
ncbi:hypothetical protein AAVH_14679 [Aphelenchoides avenae]|nr:hypothetical protein AAVH_14679 [Aphelenchus avenae]